MANPPADPTWADPTWTDLTWTNPTWTCMTLFMRSRPAILHSRSVRNRHIPYEAVARWMAKND